MTTYKEIIKIIKELEDTEGLKGYTKIDKYFIITDYKALIDFAKTNNRITEKQKTYLQEKLLKIYNASL